MSIMYKKSNSKEKSYLSIEEDEFAAGRFDAPDLTFVKSSRPTTSRAVEAKPKSSTSSAIEMLTKTADNYDTIFEEIIKSAQSESTGRGQHRPQQPKADSLIIRTKEDMIETFLDLAKAVKIDLPTLVLKQVITLISHGVQPDDIFLFLKEAIANKYAKKKMDKRGYSGANSTSSKNTEL